MLSTESHSCSNSYILAAELRKKYPHNNLQNKIYILIDISAFYMAQLV